MVHVHQRLVAHEQRPHQLQRRDLQREVERGDERDGAKGPAVAHARLAGMVAGHAEAAGEEAHLQGRRRAL